MKIDIQPIRSRVTASSEKKFSNYVAWKKAAKASFPDARHNKKGDPGYVAGYGDEKDEEFVTGPDMQSDVVAAWSSDTSQGWVKDKKKEITSSNVSSILEKLKEGFDDLHIEFSRLTGGVSGNKVLYLSYEWDNVEPNDVHHILTMACDTDTVNRTKNPLDRTEELFSGRIGNTYITVDTRMAVFCVVL